MILNYYMAALNLTANKRLILGIKRNFVNPFKLAQSHPYTKIYFTAEKSKRLKNFLCHNLKTNKLQSF